MKQTMEPEEFLNNAVKDIKKSGIDGLNPYITPEGAKKVKLVKTYAGGGFLGNLLTRNTDTPSPKKIQFLLQNMSKFDWTVKEVKKTKTGAKGTLGCKYKDKVDGTIVLHLINENNEWKINDIDMPSFKKMEV